jgi:hypothetical protein
MERHDGGLEEQRRHDQGRAGQRQRVPGLQRPAEGLDLQRAAPAVEQRNPHQQRRGGGATQHEILERSLRAVRAHEPEQHERVDRQRHDLDAEEQRREAVRRNDQAGAIHRAEHQRVVGRLCEIVA